MCIRRARCGTRACRACPATVRPIAAESRQGYAKGPEDQNLRIVERNIDLGDDGRYLIAVAGDASEIDDETRSFDRAIGVTFGALTIALLLTTALAGAVRAWRR